MIKKIIIIFIAICSTLLVSCSGSKKYFKAAEKLEKQGLVSEAAEYYYESLERKRTNTNARIKLKDVGQKHINNLSSAFFREYNTQQYEKSIETFDKLKSFVSKTAILNIDLFYPQTYQEDYNKALDYYLNKNYIEVVNLVNQNNFELALSFISKIKKYDSSYKKIKELEITATCEPLYLKALRAMENKDYSNAKINLGMLNTISVNYKDAKELLDLTSDLLKKSYMIFKSNNNSDKDIEEKLYNSFLDYSYQNSSKIKIINNTPFLYMPDASDILNPGNTDLIQAIRKATGADLFYVFDVSNKRELDNYPVKTASTCFEKFIVKKDTVFVTQYQAMPYNRITASRSYSYDFRYKLIDAISNQVISSRNETCISSDNIDYYEFGKYPRLMNGFLNPTYNLNNYFPYNPLSTPPINQYNPINWRNGFNNRKELKPFTSLRQDVDNKAISIFSNTLSGFIIK